jgi:hypothetical protein
VITNQLPPPVGDKITGREVKLTSENEYKRAIHIIENSLLADTGQKVRSIEAVNSFGKSTMLYGPVKGEIYGLIHTEKGENSSELENAIEVINQSDEVDILPADEDTGKMPLFCVLVWFSMGIFIGLMLAGLILQFTD